MVKEGDGPVIECYGWNRREAMGRMDGVNGGVEGAEGAARLLDGGMVKRMDEEMV